MLNMKKKDARFDKKIAALLLGALMMLNGCDGSREESRLGKEVRDTSCPKMELLNGYDIAAPGSVISTDSVFVFVSDNDPEYVYGFYGLEKMPEEESNEQKTESPSYEHRRNSGMKKEEISQTITLPREEGLYHVNAAALDSSGNMVTSVIYFLTDGTGPQIKLPREEITLYPDQTYDFYQDVALEDNAFPSEQCRFWIDEKELSDLQEYLQNGQTGTYPLTYYAEDALENRSKKVLTVTLTEFPAPPETVSMPPVDTENEYVQPIISTDSPYDSEMAQAALASVNEYRIGNGLAALTWNDDLYENCKVRACEISTSFSHTRPNGENCFTAFTVSYTSAGENIASGYTSAQSVAEGWWNSDAHRSNILSESYSQAAIACYYANGNYYWVNLFVG